MHTRQPLRLEPAATSYRWWVVAIYMLAPALFTPVAWLAYLDGGAVWLPFGVGLPLLALFSIWRFRRTCLSVDEAGMLRLSAAVRRAVDLDRLAEVGLVPSLHYPDQRRYGMHAQYMFELRDETGGSMRIYAGATSPWVGRAAVLREVVAAIEQGRGRCAPQCWEQLRADGGLAGAPLPPRLTAPADDAWGARLTTHESGRRNFAASMGAVLLLPAIPGIMAALTAGTNKPGLALASLAGVLVIVGPPWAYLVAVVRRGDREEIRVDRDGTVRQVRHHAGRMRLGLRLSAEQVDLTCLDAARFVAATAVDREGRPAWWRLELRDIAGGAATIDLLHERRPFATLMPLLAHHLESTGMALDPTTHRGLQLRLGRPLANPTAD